MSESFRQFTRTLRQTTHRREPNTASDAELVTRFVDSGDPIAFELLMWRHGPMVLGVCRRMLRDGNDADDAFQATFLALMRGAALIGNKGMVAAWLHRVAWRTAARLRVPRDRLPRSTQHIDPDQLPGSVHDPARDEMIRLLDEELARLPERYRLPLILCHLEGRTTAEVARQLGCPRGTILARLKRGRDRLRDRLLKRGLVPASGLAVFESVSPASAAVPAPLADVTLTNSFHLASGVDPEPVLGHVWSLSEGVMKSMWLTKCKVAVMAMLTVAIAGSGLGILAHHGMAGDEAIAIASTSDESDMPLSFAPTAERELQIEETPSSVAFSPDGSLLATLSRRTEQRGEKTIRYTRFRIFDTQTGEEIINLGEIEYPGIQLFRFSPDSKLLIVGIRQRIEEGDIVQVWDAKTGALKQTIEMDYGRSPVLCSLSPDGKTLAVVYGGPPRRLFGGARLFDIETGKLIRTVEAHPQTGVKVAFSPDGSLLASSGYDQSVALIDVKTGKVVWKDDNPPTQTPVLLFSPDGKWLVGGGINGLSIWDAKSGERTSDNDTMAVKQVLFSPDGKLLIIRTADGVDAVDVATGKVRWRWGEKAKSLAFTEDGQTLYSYDGKKTIRIWKFKKEP